MGCVAPLVLSDPRRVAMLGAELVANRLRARPGLRLVLPTGRTPLGMYAALRAHAAEMSLPTDLATLFQLDEYLGLGGDDQRSYRAYLRRELGDLPFAARHEIDGAAADPEAECERYQALLDRAPLDLVVLGLGRDGHVAFDEPGSDPDSTMRRVRLHAATRADAADDFGGIDDVPAEALTVGLRTLGSAREVLMLVSGRSKARALRALVQDKPSSDLPASALRDHPRLTLVCDTEAASLLDSHAGCQSDRVVIVLGHREPGVSTEHCISDESRSRLRRAAESCVAEPPRAVVLTGYSRTGGVSEAEQMKAEWPLRSVPTLMENAGRNTAENASRSLPIVRATGDVHRVTVVTSAWHLRSHYFFAPYRTFGLKLSFMPAMREGDWLRMVAQELRGVPSMPGVRRRALAEMRLPPQLGLDAPPSAGAAGIQPLPRFDPQPP